jgi:pentatricopeptide repeat protein
MSFEVMERYGIVPDVVALNALISAFCHQVGHTADAVEYLGKIKGKIAPDGETFTFLLEGWQKEGNVACAMSTFGEMILHVGWSTENVPAYNTLLMTLIHAHQNEEAVRFLKVIKSNKCTPGLEFFRAALGILVKEGNFVKASQLWDIMLMEPSPMPDLEMYHCMIVLCCDNRNIDFAYNLLDEMPFNGVFPDSAIYGAILDCLIWMNSAREAEKFFAEMKNNEIVPSASSCASAIRLFFKEFNPMAAEDVWRLVVEERISPADDCAREMIRGFLDLCRTNEVRRYMEEILDMGIELPSNITDKLKSLLEKTVKNDWYNPIAKRLKSVH